MKEKVKIIILLFLTSILTTLLYFNSSTFISSQEWKHNNGYSIGDWVTFDTESLENDRDPIIFCLGKELIIEDSYSGEKGYYTNKTW